MTALPSLMGQLFLDLHRRRLPALIAGGYDWVDVRDVVAAMMAAETQGRCGENYLVSGHWHTVRELAELSQQATGVAAPRLQFPIFAARLWAPCQVVLDRCRGRRPLYTPVSVRIMAHSNQRISSAKAQAEPRVPPALARRIGQGHVPLVRRTRHAAGRGVTWSKNVCTRC